MSVSRAADIVNQALDYRATRQDLIASNIANADTPFYKPRDISFETTLQAKKNEIFHTKTNELEMAKTNERHITSSKELSTTKATLFYRDGHMARNDGNSVDIDVETTEMSKNSTMYNALIQAKKRDSTIFRSVIEASQKIN
ncbi:MAG: flagellar basal body rod protein FlgB [Campylobacterales bacterium]|nr:flagellar basal body rod protein FlgB [Campylobacterales bacterium]